MEEGKQETDSITSSPSTTSIHELYTQPTADYLSRDEILWHNSNSSVKSGSVISSSKTRLMSYTAKTSTPNNFTSQSKKTLIVSPPKKAILLSSAESLTPMDINYQYRKQVTPNKPIVSTSECLKKVTV